MTPGTDSDLARVLAETGPILLDFDGPVCQVYPGDLNMRAADQLRARLRHYDIEPPETVAAEKDPLAVLRYAGTLREPAIVEDVERTLTGIEAAASPDAPQTPGASEFLRACRDSSRPVVIVSNNATEAIEIHLRLHGLAHLVFAVIGRPPGEPAQMKPHPQPVDAALRLVQADPGHCVLVGDSVTDVQVARSLGLRSIAYVKSEDRFERLAAQRPDALVTTMAGLAHAVLGEKPLISGDR